jgi:hypothetical protein
VQRRSNNGFSKPYRRYCLALNGALATSDFNTDIAFSAFHVSESWFCSSADFSKLGDYAAMPLAYHALRYA